MDFEIKIVKRTFFVCAFLLSFFISNAQIVSNASFCQEGNQITIQYYLSQKSNIQVFIVKNDTNGLIDTCYEITNMCHGDIGKNIREGKRKVSFLPLENNIELNGRYSFRIVGDTNLSRKTIWFSNFRIATELSCGVGGGCEHEYNINYYDGSESSYYEHTPLFSGMISASLLYKIKENTFIGIGYGYGAHSYPLFFKMRIYCVECSVGKCLKRDSYFDGMSFSNNLFVDILLSTNLLFTLSEKKYGSGLYFGYYGDVEKIGIWQFGLRLQWHIKLL